MGLVTKSEAILDPGLGACELSQPLQTVHATEAAIPRAEEDISAGGGAHGDDERILEGSLLSLIQFLWYAVVEVAASEG